MKKFFSFAICAMAVLFASCEQNEPSKHDKGSGATKNQLAFSVSKSKQVIFSKGNLQYTRSTDTWSFASAQYEIIGTDNVIDGSVQSDPYNGDSKDGTALADKIDLFGWSTSATNFGVITSISNSDYSGPFVDWGTNKIGNDAPNTWRTLTSNEWDYLCEERPNHFELCGHAQVNGVNGFILLPDNWSSPKGVTFISVQSVISSEYEVETYSQYQTFTAEQWSKLEAAGAVFLPAAGYRVGLDVGGVQYLGFYWSATECTIEGDGERSYYFDFDENSYGRTFPVSRRIGNSIRLVKDL